MSDGDDCRCYARWRGECECGADWTPQEVIDLRAEVEALTRERNELHCRLMARPRLAPEHLKELRELLRECEAYDRSFGVVNKDSAAIRAALAALGEE